MKEAVSFIRSTAIYRSIGSNLNRFRGFIFDLKHNVKTGGKQTIDSSHVNSENLKSGFLYVGSNPKHIKSIFESLEIKHQRFVFIDVGSGKGRVLLLASEYPFKKIIGVEFSSKMNAIAQQNIETFRSKTQKCRDLESICEDATKFGFPLEPTVIYLFNPFNAEVLSRFITNLEVSVAENPREIIIVYAAAFFEDVIIRSKLFTKDTAKSGDWHSVFRHDPQTKVEKPK